MWRMSCGVGLWASVAHAAPVEMTLQARLVGPSGAPVEGLHDVTARLYPTAGAASAAFTQSFDDVVVQDGYVALRLGGAPALDSAVASANGWLGLTVDGGVELARQPVGAVPVAAASFSVDGPVRITGAATCSAGEAGRLRYTGGQVDVCDGVDFRRLARATDGATPRERRAQLPRHQAHQPGRAHRQLLSQSG
jgi:hypothetical protein